MNHLLKHSIATTFRSWTKNIRLVALGTISVWVKARLFYSILPRIKSRGNSLRNYSFSFFICIFAYLLISITCPDFSGFAFAQAPQSFKYQVIARNAAGKELANTNLKVRILLHDNTASGTVVYMETHSVITNIFGLFNINIGQGTPVAGVFDSIGWGSGSKFIEQEIDFGNGFQSMGTSQLLSVPYALFAENGPSGPAGAKGEKGDSGATNGWLLTGNAGTTDSNFIGTTDNVPLNFRVNNQRAGRIDHTYAGNTFFGYLTGNSNDIGSFNTAVGQRVLFLNTGSGNTSIGYGSLFNNTIGGGNTASGTSALYQNTSGWYNTADGNATLISNTTGSHNSAFGVSALRLNTIGRWNSANGIESLFSNNTGDNNSALGAFTGKGNTAGSYNTYLGYNANSSDSLTNATAIGANAIVSTSNSLVLGDTNVNVGIGVTAPSAKLEIAGQIKITGGSPAMGKVLTSDAAGLASWASPSGSSTGWSLTGNAGTIDSINFIGTTDNVPLNFRVNNQMAGRIDFDGNTFWGHWAGKNTTGYSNTAIGNYALYFNTTGSANTAYGLQALALNTTGNRNIAVGLNALSHNTIGNDNTVIGYEAMIANVSGISNTAIGYYSLTANKTGNSNRTLCKTLLIS